MPGRRPKPTALKQLAGNPGHRPLNNAEPQPKQCAPEMPKGMARAAQREWGRIVPELLQLGILTSIDGKALAAYCDAYALWEEARRDWRKHGIVLESPVLDKMGEPVFVGLDGTQALIVRKANPSIAIYHSAAKLMKSFLIEFGLTPASRSKLKIEKQPEEDAFEKAFMGGQAQQTAKDNAPLMFNTGKPDYAANIPASATDFEA